MPVLLTMATKRQSHCGRPGCRVARAVHHILARACEHFVEPGSKEAHELLRAHLALIAAPPAPPPRLTRSGLTWRAQESLDAIQAQRLADDAQLAPFCFACPQCLELDEDCQCSEDAPVSVEVAL